MCCNPLLHCTPLICVPISSNHRIYQHYLHARTSHFDKVPSIACSTMAVYRVCRCAKWPFGTYKAITMLAGTLLMTEHCSHCTVYPHNATACKTYLGERALKELQELTARLMITPVSSSLSVDDLYIATGAGNVCAGCLCTHMICEEHAVWQCLHVAHCWCRGANFGTCPLTLLMLLGELLLSLLLLLLDLQFLLSDSCLGSCLFFLCQ